MDFVEIGLDVSIAPASRKKEKRKSRIVMNRNGETVLRRTFSGKRSYRYCDITFKKPDLNVRNVVAARLLPGCSRDRCSELRVRPKCRHRKKKKCHTKREEIISIYEDVSSGSLESDYELDRLIAATRIRMRDELHQRITPKLAVLEASNDNYSESTFELNSIHSLDTVKLETFEYHSPVNIEPNNNDLNDYHLNNEFIDMKPNIKPELW